MPKMRKELLSIHNLVLRTINFELKNYGKYLELNKFTLYLQPLKLNKYKNHVCNRRNCWPTI